MLGPLQLEVDGALVPLGPPKQRAVLALLAMHADRVVPVDTIIESIWDGAPPANAVGNLQAYVSNLRRLLEPDRRRPSVLVSAAQGYGLMTPALGLDVRDVETRLQDARALLAAGSPDEALATYDDVLGRWRGDTYADVRLEEWAQAEITRVEELRATAEEDRGAALVQAGRPGDAVPAFESLVQRHPLRERPWELLAVAQAGCGRQADALATLRRHRELLADELGLDPSPRMQDLETAILRQEGVGALTPAPVRPAPATTDPAFVGRTDELAILAQAAHDAESSFVAVLVDGEPGVGKTTLVREAFERSGQVVLWGRSPDHETAPALWAWEQVWSALSTARPDLAVPPALRGFLDGAGSPAPAYDVVGARLRLFEEGARFLSAAAPVRIVLEDLHSADLASLGMLEHLAAAAPAGVLVVATYRSHEASGLTSTLARLGRHGARRLSLRGLASDEVRALVRQVTGADPGETTAEELVRRTAGNPFYLTELALSGAPLTDAVRDVVRARVEALGELPRTVLEAAAAVGDEVEPWLVAEVSGRSLADAVDALDTAERAGLVQGTPDGRRVRFTHALVVDALLEGRSSVWSAAAHERCAAALTRTRGHLKEQHGEIARHWLAAAELGPEQARSAAEFCARAGRSALARHAPEDALAFWHEAVAAGQLAGATGVEAFEHRLGLSEALYDAGRFDDGYDSAMEALLLAEDDPDRVVRCADVCMAQSIWLPFRYGHDPVSLRTALDRAVDDSEPGTATHALGLACAGVLLASTGRDDEVDAVSAQAVRETDGLDDPALLRRVLHLRLVAMRGPDFVEQRAQTSRALLAQPGLPLSLRVVADMHLVSHDVEHGRVAEAEARLGRLARDSAATRNPTLARQLRSMQVGLDLFHARYAEALSLLDLRDEVTAASDDHFFQSAELGQRTFTAFETGTLGEIVPLMETLHADTGVAGFGYGLGLALVETGDVARARGLLATVAMPPRDWTWVSAAVVRTHLAIALGDEAALREVRDLMLPFSGLVTVAGTCTNIVGAWDGHLGEAALALGDLDTARHELTAALRLLAACDAPYWTERARQALAKCS